MAMSVFKTRERFPSYQNFELSDDSSNSNDNNETYFHGSEDETELNGDIGLIPQPYHNNISSIVTDFFDGSDDSLMLNRNYLYNFSYESEIDTFAEQIVPHLVPEEEPQLNTLSTSDLNNILGDREISNFDLATFLEDPTPNNNNAAQRKYKSTGKRIDIQAQRYIIDDEGDTLDPGDEIDVETVFEGTSLPVLEATDALSLLEQFEASEKPLLPSAQHNGNSSSNSNSSSMDSCESSNTLIHHLEMTFDETTTNPIEILGRIPKTPIDIFEDDVNIKTVAYDGQSIKQEPSFHESNEQEVFEEDIKVFELDSRSIKNEFVCPDEMNVDKENFDLQLVKKELVCADERNVEKENLAKVETPVKNEVVVDTKPKKIKVKHEKKCAKPNISDSNSTQNYAKSKHILDALPQELIARINESGKRKTITVIPPIPNKKRGASRSVDNASQHRNKIPKVSNNEHIQIDHDYCATVSSYPKEPQKDSGFQSSEEDDRYFIKNQPTVKTADGKLMVSLLKNNTVHNTNQKKKLNIAEYKKRRFISPNTTCQSNSPISSTCSSPLPEDENLKRIKHQEKLMKMAADLLNTPAKSAKQTESNVVQKNPPVLTPPERVVVAPPKIVPPPDLEVKEYLSTGMNTDISTIKTSKTLLASTQQLEEIKPLLKKVSNKINSNSFITSLIENIPKVKTKTSTYVKPENQEVVREDKIIHYLRKDRLPAKTTSVGTQTDFDDDMQSRYRRRTGRSSSPSSSSSGSITRSRGRRRRDSSSSSCHSSRSHSSDSSTSSHSSRSSRSRSRSLSPKRSRQYSAERLREVEERRVVYVGRISKGTTKEDLRRRFLPFGTITNVSLHFRDYGDNYGFVTFGKKEDAYEAVEHGNDGSVYPKYELSFGGRRIFCQTSYSDLDNVREDDYNYYKSRPTENSFDALLRELQEKMRKRKP
ncbi:unnamed protein product [Tenebrio molitor]|nr:unnamed protein product [Tenebrio molitor]